MGHGIGQVPLYQDDDEQLGIVLSLVPLARVGRTGPADSAAAGPIISAHHIKERENVRPK